MLRRFLCLTICLAMLAHSTAAIGAILYGDFLGPNISYLSVTEDPTVLPGPTPAELFEEPDLNSNTLIFTPAAFSTTSNGGLSFANSNVNIMVRGSISQQIITGLSLNEMGAYSLIGGTPAGTKVGVSLDTIQAQVMEVNGLPVEPILLPKSFTYSNGGTGTSTTTFGGIQFSASGGPIVNQPWNATVEFDMGAAPGATMIELVLGNSIFSMSDPDATAFIDTKILQINPEFVVVPEPSAIVLGLTAVASLGILNYRRRRML